MEEQRPNLTVIEGGLSQNSEKINIKPTTGLPEGKVGPGLENNGFVAKVRRVLSKVAKKLDTNPENIPPQGKAF